MQGAKFLPKSVTRELGMKSFFFLRVPKQLSRNSCFKFPSMDYCCLLRLLFVAVSKYASCTIKGAHRVYFKYYSAHSLHAALDFNGCRNERERERGILAPCWGLTATSQKQEGECPASSQGDASKARKQRPANVVTMASRHAPKR